MIYIANALTRQIFLRFKLGLTVLTESQMTRNQCLTILLPGLFLGSIFSSHLFMLLHHSFSNAHAIFSPILN